MSAAVIEHNRRAVYTALSGVCGDRLLLERAFSYWEANFATQTAFRVAQYIDGLMSHVGLNQVQRRALAVALYAALSKQDKDLSQVPAMFRAGSGAVPAAAAPVSAKAAAPSAAAAGAAASIVLARMLRGLIDGAVRGSSIADLVAAVQASCAELRGGTRTAADEWVAGSFDDCEWFAARTAPADRRAVVNAVYVAVCDVAGPSAADKILARAVEAAEKLAESAEAPPRSLL
jgi:hypothetical protein